MWQHFLVQMPLVCGKVVTHACMHMHAHTHTYMHPHSHCASNITEADCCVHFLQMHMSVGMCPLSENKCTCKLVS